MLSMLRGPLTAGLIAISMLSCTADALGAAKIVRGTAATGEVATVAPSIGEQAFMRSRYWRMRTFAPYFNSRLSWAPGAWVTQHAYALEPAELAAHPEWQLTRHEQRPAVRRVPRGRGLRQPRLPRLVDREGPGGRRRRLQGSVHRRRLHGAPHVPQRRHHPAQPEGPAHGHDDDRGQLAEVPGGLHGRGPRGAAERRDRARRALAEGRQRQRAARPAGRERRLGRRRLHHQRGHLQLRHARELG